MEITIPHNYIPREYQKPFYNCISEGFKRGFVVWHRRAGKDKTLINIFAREIFSRVGVYFYFFPTFAQGKKVIWDGVDGSGFPFLGHFPEATRARTINDEMKIVFKNGSIFQIIGTDNFDKIRGTNPIGAGFSEFAFQNPSAWDVVRPILLENNGWALFDTTPNGKNHAYDLWRTARDNPQWHTQILTVNDTRRGDGSPVITPEMIQEERISGMTEEMIQQEYFCSFDIGALGAIYAREIQQAEEEGRITSLPFSLDKQIDVFFDLGISKGNETAYWFVQKDGIFHNFVNYNEAYGKTFDWHASYIEEYIDQKKGKLGKIYIPHDSSKRDWVSGTTPQQAFEKRFGQNRIVWVPPNSPSDSGGFQKARAIFPKCRFDKENCKQGLNALENYQYEWDDIKKVFRREPKHDWSSNGADAFRYFAISAKEESPKIDTTRRLPHNFDRFSVYH
jgi:hypothetical protein